MDLMGRKGFSGRSYGYASDGGRGLLKKAHELAVLCDTHLVVVIFSAPASSATSWTSPPRPCSRAPARLATGSWTRSSVSPTPRVRAQAGPRQAAPRRGEARVRRTRAALGRQGGRAARHRRQVVRRAATVRQVQHIRANHTACIVVDIHSILFSIPMIDIHAIIFDLMIRIASARRRKIQVWEHHSLLQLLGGSRCALLPWPVLCSCWVGAGVLCSPGWCSAPAGWEPVFSAPAGWEPACCCSGRAAFDLLLGGAGGSSGE